MYNINILLFFHNCKEAYIFSEIYCVLQKIIKNGCFKTAVKTYRSSSLYGVVPAAQPVYGDTERFMNMLSGCNKKECAVLNILEKYRRRSVRGAKKEGDSLFFCGREHARREKV